MPFFEMLINLSVRIYHEKDWHCLIGQSCESEHVKPIASHKSVLHDTIFCMDIADLSRGQS